LRVLADGGGAVRGRLRRVLAELQSTGGLRGRAVRAAAGVRPPRGELRGRMGVDEERGLADAVPRIVERLRLREARRLKRSVRGELDRRGLFRDNISRGGVPFVLPRRVRRRRHPRVVLLVDVSWSTARAAGLFLSIAGAFVTRHRDVRVHAFVDRTVDATDAVARWLRLRPAGRGAAGVRSRRSAPGAGIVRGGVSFADVLRGLEGLNLDAPSDYGRAFHGLLARGSLPRGRGSVLVVLGDGRVNRFDPQAWAFEELARGRGAVLWLVPEPFAEWGDGDSALAAYLPHCDAAVEARDLDGLARGVAELVRRL